MTQSQAPSPATPGYTESVHHIPVLGTPDRFIYAILAVPTTTTTAPTTELAIIAHGFAGHKDYCYQKLLAQTLPEQTGTATLRFDFSGCGDSIGLGKPVPGEHKEDEEEREKGHCRTLESDVTDLDSVAAYVATLSPGFRLTTTVGHSRGALAIFAWLARHSSPPTSSSSVLPTAHVRTVINCASRFHSSRITPSYVSRYPTFARDGGMWLTCRVAGGRYAPVWTDEGEIRSLAKADVPGYLRALADPGSVYHRDSGSDSDSGNGNGNGSAKRKRFRVLSVYGEADTVLSRDDADAFNAHLQPALARLANGALHQLKVIKDADHNYFGKEIQEEETKGQEEKGKRKKKVNYNPTVVQLIVNFIESV